MAQDFMEAFAVGHNDRMIASQDTDGVVLAAIQGLHTLVKRRDARIDQLEAEVAQLRGDKAELAGMKRAVEVLMARTATDRAAALRQ